jgi:hypothetical protein
MAMFASGQFSWYTVEGPIIPTYRLRLNNAPGTTPPLPSVAPGAGYSHYLSYTAGAGDPIYSFASPAAVPRTTPTPFGIIYMTAPPTQIAAGSSSRAWGFPFTTGMITISAPFSPTPTLMVYGTGMDNRTPQGIGNITMVAGGLIGPGIGAAPGLILAQLWTFTLNVPEPSRVLMLGSGVALLGLVAVARRRRTSARAE